MYSWGSNKTGLLGLGKIEAKIVNVPSLGECISTYVHTFTLSILKTLIYILG